MHLNYVNWYGKHRDENVQVSKAVLAHACINIFKQVAYKRLYISAYMPLDLSSL